MNTSRYTIREIYCIFAGGNSKDHGIENVKLRSEDDSFYVYEFTKKGKKMVLEICAYGESIKMRASGDKNYITNLPKLRKYFLNK